MSDDTLFERIAASAAAGTVTVEDINAFVEVLNDIAGYEVPAAFERLPSGHVVYDPRDVAYLRALQPSPLSYDPRRAELEQRLFLEQRANAKWRRQFPETNNRVRMAVLMKLVPKGIVSKAAANKWCDRDPRNSKIDALKIDGEWYVIPESFWRAVERAARRKEKNFTRPT